MIAAVAWVANYLHFTNFGLYEDDWFYLGFPFLVSPRIWMGMALRDQFRPQYFQGRPLQSIFGFSFAEIGALTRSISVDYLIAYALFAGSAIMMYAVLRRRFSRLVATLAALVFVLSPLHTLHQFLNGQFSFGPAFLLVFLAMLLYTGGNRAWSYIPAFMSLLCYESVFFLFIPIPLLIRHASLLRGRVREWAIHLGVCGTIVAAYFLTRSLVAEKRVTGVAAGPGIVWKVAGSWIFTAAASSATYLFALVRAHEASLEACLYAAVFAMILARFFFLLEKRAMPAGDTGRRLRGIARSAIIALAFLFMGFALSYFFFLEYPPHFHSTDRDTRIHVAGSFGSSLLAAVVLAGWIRLSRRRAWRIVSYAGVSGVLIVLFLYSFVLQQDYVDDWQEQRAEAARMILLTPDVERDSIIVLKFRERPNPFLGSGLHLRAIGKEKTLYEWHFPHVFALGEVWPRLFVVYSDTWIRDLTRDSDGQMSWAPELFAGHAMDRGTSHYRAGRFIVLEEVEPGRLARRNSPIYVDGVQIVQQARTGANPAPLWNSLHDNVLTRQLVPDFVMKPQAP